MIGDRRERPWKKVRVVVEVTVPPASRIQEIHLKRLVEDALPKQFDLPVPLHANAFTAAVRVKGFLAFLPSYFRYEVHSKKMKKDYANDPNKGL